MLCLSRRAGDGVILLVNGERVIVHVLEVKDGHGNTKLGFDAPQSVKILRSELLDGQPAARDGSDE